MAIEFVRTLRTASSERFLLRSGKTDFAALDIHYLPTNRVDATLILFEGAGRTESDVPGLLTEIDEVILPEVSLQEKNLVFNVVIGQVLGAFAAEPKPSTAQQKV